MKYVLVLPDGAADEPTDKLDGKTPLEVANKPNMDWIASNGRQGTVVTVPPGYTPGQRCGHAIAAWATPQTRTTTGARHLEAAAKGIEARRIS